MINHFRGNGPLLSLVAFFASYICIGMFLVRGPVVFEAVGWGLTLMGGYILLNYTRDFVDVIWNQNRGAYGAHLKIIGVELIGFGLFYSGMWRAAYLYFGEPELWRQTWHGSLGWVAVVGGAFLIGTGPDTFARRSGLPSLFWRVAAVVTFGLLCYAAGAYTL